MSKPTVTAASLRAYFRADPKRVARLSAEAQVTVAEGARGKVHPEAVKVHNRFRKVQYVQGASKDATAQAHEAAKALRAEAAAAGFPVGKRGPLPKGFLASKA
jgi:hypothetical protein